MQQSSKTRARALILFTLLATVVLAPKQARADEPIICGGDYGYSIGEPFWVGDVWSLQVTSSCSDGTTEYGIGPVGPDGGPSDTGWTWWGSDFDREMDLGY